MRAAIAHHACACSPPQCCVFASLRRPGGPCAAAPRQTRRARRARRAAETRTSARRSECTPGEMWASQRAVQSLHQPVRSNNDPRHRRRAAVRVARGVRFRVRHSPGSVLACSFLHSHFSCSAHVSLSLSSESRSSTPPPPRVPHGSAAAPRTRGRPSAAASGSVAALNSSRRAPPNVPLYTGACALPVVQQCCTYHAPPP